MSWFAECTIPVSLRSLVYGSYARLFDCNLNEAKQSDLKAYPCLMEFFTRELAPSVRPINRTAQLVSFFSGNAPVQFHLSSCFIFTHYLCCIQVSPSDGQILHFGPVDPKHEVLDQVKGVRYSLAEFLGPPEHALWPAEGSTVSGRQLYQCVIYLAPGDCHRFYTPTNWTIVTRRHFPGRLLFFNFIFDIVSRFPLFNMQCSSNIARPRTIWISVLSTENIRIGGFINSQKLAGNAVLKSNKCGYSSHHGCFPDKLSTICTIYAGNVEIRCEVNRE